MTENLSPAEAEPCATPEEKIQVCLNCGNQVPVRFCSWCGQSTRDVRVSFRSLVVDFLGDVFTYDSKLFHTLKPLVTKPGALTLMFMQGKRARFVPPLRLYLFTSIIFFLVLSAALKPDTNSARVVITEDEAGVTSPSGKEKFEITGFDMPENTWWGHRLNEKMKSQEARLEKMGAIDAQNAILTAFFGMLPKAFFFLMPIFALFMKLVYIRRDPLYIDHLIFAFHFHSFLYLFYSILFPLIVNLSSGWAVLTVFLMILTTMIYLYRSMIRVFAQSHARTFIKFCIIGFSYFVCLLLSLFTGLIISLFLA